jgi:hypothetical protein
VLGSNGREVAGQIGLGDGRQHGDPVLVALTTADHDLVRREIALYPGRYTDRPRRDA